MNTSIMERPIRRGQGRKDECLIVPFIYGVEAMLCPAVEPQLEDIPIKT